MTKRFLPLLAFLALAGCSGPNNKAEIKLATPSPQQIDFMNNEIGAFFHFTTNTFTGAEHGDGTATPADFNPTKLDVDQWMEAAKSLGAKYAVLTARQLTVEKRPGRRRQRVRRGVPPPRDQTRTLFLPELQRTRNIPTQGPAGRVGESVGQYYESALAGFGIRPKIPPAGSGPDHRTADRLRSHLPDMDGPLE